MGIKIYTYKDPFHLDKYSYWNEIKQYPHLCVSQTLVQGLDKKYKRSEFSYLYCIDDLMEILYCDWIKNIEVRVNQYIKLSEIINKIPHKKIKNSFKFNQNNVLDAIRMIKELELDLKVDEKNLSEEQNWFIKIKNRVEKEDCFNILEKSKIQDKEDLLKALNKLLINEGKKKKKILDNLKNEKSKLELEKELDTFREVLKANNKNNILDTVVIHGVHKFDSKLFYFIRNLKSLGINIIFLINYNDDYKRIYETWTNVYKWTNKELHIEDIYIEEFYSDLGIAIGKLLEGDFEAINDCSLNTYKVNVFDNMTSFSNSICEVYEKAYNSTTNILNNNNDFNSGKILNNMRTQYYAVNNNDINEILKTYYPEQFGDKHFLAYPIGQFILGIYNMWDNEKEKIIINESSIKECLSVEFWNNNTSSSIIETYDKIKIYFKDKASIDDIIVRLDMLKNNLSKVSSNKEYNNLKRLSFYTVDIDDIDLLKDILKSIEEIGNAIFKDTKVKRDKISYSNHYKKLLSIISTKINDSKLVSEKEKEFVKELQEKLNTIENEGIVGGIEDINKTLHFYLNTPTNEQQSKWIVRNFQQVDGGVLLSDSANVDKKYHYCLVSDKMMNPKINDLLPWPIDMKMLELFNRDNKYLDAIVTSLKEYKNFLRYSLFYATLFCKQDIELSFVKDSGDDEDQNLYFILEMLGIKQDKNKISSVDNNLKNNKKIMSNVKLDKFKEPSRIELQKASICMYRYMLDHLIDQNMYFFNEYQIKYYTIVLMFADVVSRLKNINYKNINEMIIESEVKKTKEIFRIYLEFFNEVDIKDITTKVKKDIIDYINEGCNNDDEYIEKKLEFLMASIKDLDDNKDENLIKSIHYSKLDYKKILKYLSDYNMKDEEINPLICEYCAQREVCLNSFEVC
ncbi:MAG: hypothetical protein KHZ48_02170 [Peptostreptococcaceae bacterium]|nr:hypothetical protein [Peptostreptococcaceae bacterium]